MGGLCRGDRLFVIRPQPSCSWRRIICPEAQWWCCGSGDSMAKKTLNTGNLETLGATRLAELLMEVSEGNAVAKRRLRLALAGAESPAEVAKQVRKRLATIARSRSFVDWQNRKSLVDDLETQRRAIVDQVARHSPAEALDLMWRFLDLAQPVFARCDDSSGAVIQVFHSAVTDLGAIAQSARPNPEELGDQVFGALRRNDYGQFDDLIQALQPALGPIGLEHLKQRMIALSAEQVRKLAANERQVIGWSSGGAIYADEIAESRASAPLDWHCKKSPMHRAMSTRSSPNMRSR